jgi:hypothetical protein
MDDLVRVVVSIMVMVGVGVFGYAAVAGLNVLLRRGQRKAGLSQQELELVHARLAATEGLEARVEELEQRVDFAERLIAQQNDPERLPSGRPDLR